MNLTNISFYGSIINKESQEGMCGRKDAKEGVLCMINGTLLRILLR